MASERFHADVPAAENPATAGDDSSESANAPYWPELPRETSDNLDELIVAVHQVSLKLL